MFRLLCLALLLTPYAASADPIYRTTDKEGNVEFTDAPPADGRATDRVGLQRTNTTPPPEEISKPSGDGQTAEQPSVQPYTVIITSPANETTIPNGPGDFSVSVKIQPALQKYESLQLFMDGVPWGEPQPSTFWDLTNVNRGEHDVTVGVIDGAGETIAMSPPVRVFVFRPSLNSKAK